MLSAIEVTLSRTGVAAPRSLVRSRVTLYLCRSFMFSCIGVDSSGFFGFLFSSQKPYSMLISYPEWGPVHPGCIPVSCLVFVGGGGNSVRYVSVLLVS